MPPITQSQIDAYNVLSHFTNFADRATDEDAIAQINTGENGKSGIKRAQGDAVRGFFKVWKVPEGRDVAMNDIVRSTFKTAVLKLFNVETVEQLPEDVQDAITSGSLGSAENSGKPLSARRITAVMNAVKKDAIYKTLDQLKHASERAKEALSPVKDGRQQNLAQLKDSLVSYAMSYKNKFEQLPEQTELQKSFANFFGKVATHVNDSGCDLPGEFEKKVRREFDGFRALAKDALRRANPNATDDDLESALSTTFRRARLILDRIVIRKEMLNAFKFKIPDDMKQESAFIRDLETMEEKVYGQIRPKMTINEFTARQDDIVSNGKSVERTVGDVVEKYAKALQQSKQYLKDDVAIFKRRVEMTAEQESLFDDLIGSYKDKLLQIRKGCKVTFAGDNISIERSDVNKAGADLKKHIAALARLAMGGKCLPLNSQCDFISSQDVNYANGKPFERFCELAKGKEKTAAQLLKFGSTDVAIHILSDSERMKTAFPDGKSATRESIFATLFPEETFNTKLNDLGEAEFRRKMDDAFIAKCMRMVDEATLGGLNNISVDFIVHMPSGILGPALDIDTAIKLYAVPKEGAHITEKDLLSVPHLKNPDEVKVLGRAALKDQIAIDINRTKTVVTIGGTAFDFKALSDAKGAADAAEEIILALERTCNGNQEQAWAIGWALSQNGAGLERMLNIPGGEHAPSEMSVTVDPDTGDAQLKKNVIDSSGKVDLSYGYLVKVDGTSEMNKLNIDKKQSVEDGTFSLEDFRKIAEDSEKLYGTEYRPEVNEDQLKIAVRPSDELTSLRSANDNIHLRHDLLLAVRNELGGTESKAYKIIRDMLFDGANLTEGMRGNGPWARKSIKLTRWEIMSVFKVLDNREQYEKLDPENKIEDIAKYHNMKGNYVSVVGNTNSIHDFFKTVPEFPGLKYEYALTDNYWNNLDNRLDFSNYIASSKGLGGVATLSSKIPTGFENDCGRTSYFVIGDKKLSLLETAGAEKVTAEQLNDEVARFVTKNPDAKFDRLQGADLKRVQFVMSNMWQGTQTPVYEGMRTAIFGSSMIVSAEKQDIVYTVKDDGNGGFAFSSTTRTSVNILAGGDGKMCFCNSEKSSFVTTAEFGYSKERVDAICDHDWTMSKDTNPTDTNSVAPTTFNVYAMSQLSGAAAPRTGE